jgi:TolA-binding protein
MRMMISRTLKYCLLLIILLGSPALTASTLDVVKAPLNLVKKPIGFVKKMMGLDKEKKKDKVNKKISDEQNNADPKRKYFKDGYAFFSEGNYNDAAIELYRFIAASSPDEDDYEWAQFFFGISLERLDYSHAATDVLGNLITRKPNPRIVSYSFELIEKNMNTLPHDEDFIVHQVVGDQDYGFVDGDIADFVNYLQGAYDWEHKFFEWGNEHFNKISPTSTYYFKYLYKEALYCVYRGNIDEAISYLNEILKSDYPSQDLKDESRKTLARLLYEKGQYDEADMIYAGIQKSILDQAENLLERAWVHYRMGHNERAMGLLYSFQAPSFRNAFRPEYFILKSFIYKDVCHYQNALSVVYEFEERYGDALEKLYERSLPHENDALMLVLLNKPKISRIYKFLDLLEKELEECQAIPDRALREHLVKIYELQIEESREKLRKLVNDGYEIIANDLLKYEEDANLMEYEIGLDMYQRVYESHYSGEKTEKEKVEEGLALYEFQGEYWNDELAAYEVSLPNRCENMEEWDVFFK